MRAKWILLSAVALAATGGALATMRHQAVAAAPDVLIMQLSRGAVIEQYVAQVASMLRSADLAGDGLDSGDIALVDEQRRAQARASSINQMLVRDLNGDFKVTRTEIERTTRGEEPFRSQQVTLQLERFDANRDGVITLNEAAAAARDYDVDDKLQSLLALDPNKDGRLTADELRRMAERAFANVDSDGDGKISEQEYAAIQERVREIRNERTTPRCVLPPASDKAKLVLFGAYESDAISSAVVGGQAMETNLIDVTIEPGTTPLYLVLTSHESMVWRLSGATDRVARVVISSANTPRSDRTAPPPVTVSGAGESRGVPRAFPTQRDPQTKVSASGVIGLPKDKVTIAHSDCPPDFYKTEGGEARRVIASIQRAVGRAPDLVFGAYSARRISLPSGGMTRSAQGETAIPAGFDAETWRDATRFWPGGLVPVDPRRIVAAVPVESYKVLPSQMGLAQLVGSGALQRISSNAFRIVRPIAHMPPSMGGAHSVTLVLAKNVPLPPGDPVHSCVIQEAAGVAKGARCNLSQ